MEAQALQQHENRNPRTIEEGRALVRHVKSLFMPWNIDALVDGFTEDCTVRFGTVPEFCGRTALRAFFTARSAKQKDYRLRKQLRVLAGDAMTNVWDGEWQDAATGAPMKGLASNSGSCATARSRSGKPHCNVGAPTRPAAWPRCLARRRRERL